MQITAIRSWLVKIPWDHNPGTGTVRDPGQRGFIFVQVETDAGITGWGEVTTYPGPVANRAVAAYIDQIGHWLRGEDPAHIELLWHKIFRAMTYVGTRGATTAAISAIDIALWDIRGKVLGQPIYQLMGGPVRDRIALYCHPYGTKSPEAIVESAREIKAAGFKAFKMDPMIHNLHVGNASFLDGELSAEVEAAALDILAAARADRGQP
jgi:galactonate dehydratase